MSLIMAEESFLLGRFDRFYKLCAFVSLAKPKNHLKEFLSIYHNVEILVVEASLFHLPIWNKV